MLRRIEERDASPPRLRFTQTTLAKRLPGSSGRGDENVTPEQIDRYWLNLAQSGETLNVL